MGHEFYTDEYMMQTLIKVAHDLGHEPKRTGRPGERHRWHDDTVKSAIDLGYSLPTLETYRNRFGSIPDLIAKVMGQVNIDKEINSDVLLHEIIVRLDRLEKHLGSIK